MSCMPMLLDLGRQHASLWTDSSQCAPLKRTHSVQGSDKVGDPSHSLEWDEWDEWARACSEQAARCGAKDKFT